MTQVPPEMGKTRKTNGVEGLETRDVRQNDWTGVDGPDLISRTGKTFRTALGPTTPPIR